MNERITRCWRCAAPLHEGVCADKCIARLPPMAEQSPWIGQSHLGRMAAPVTPGPGWIGNTVPRRFDSVNPPLSEYGARGLIGNTGPRHEI